MPDGYAFASREKHEESERISGTESRLVRRVEGACLSRKCLSVLSRADGTRGAARRANNLSPAAATAAAMETAGRMRRVTAGHGEAAAAAAAGSGNKKVREKPLVSSAEIYGSRRVDGNLKF